MSVYRKEINMTYWKITDKILARTVNFWNCTFLKFCLSLVGYIWKFYLLIYALDGNLHSEIGLNGKKIKFSHDNKITFQVFNTLSFKFPQIITNLTENTELAFTERLKRLLSSCLLCLCHISWMNQLQTLLLGFLMNVLSHSPNFIFPFKSSIFKIRILPGNTMVSFLKVVQKITN